MRRHVRQYIECSADLCQVVVPLMTAWTLLDIKVSLDFQMIIQVLPAKVGKYDTIFRMLFVISTLCPPCITGHILSIASSQVSRMTSHILLELCREFLFSIHLAKFLYAASYTFTDCFRTHAHYLANFFVGEAIAIMKLQHRRISWFHLI